AHFQAMSKTIGVKTAAATTTAPTTTMIQVRRRAISARRRPSQAGLAIRALGGDLAVAQRQDVAAVHLVAAGAARGARCHPLHHGRRRAGALAHLVPAPVGATLV